MIASLSVLFTMSQWFYAVGRGRQVGVYTSWAECQKQVDKIVNAKYRKFKTQEEALAFIQECNEKYSPIKSPSKVVSQSDFVNSTNKSVFFTSPHSKLLPNTQKVSSSLPAKPLSVHNSFSQPLHTDTASSLSSSKLIDCIPSAVPCNTYTLEEKERVSPETITELQSLADQCTYDNDPFKGMSQMNVTSGVSDGGSFEINKYFEKIDKYFSDIKVTLDYILLKVNNLENKVEELVNQSGISNKNLTKYGTAVTGIKRSLLETYNIPHSLGSRHLSTTGHEDEIEVVPVPPKKIPKVELNSDDEVDGCNYDFKVNEDGYVVVYTDGACEKNGKFGAKAGIGVWFGDGHPLNISEPVHGRATNNTAEIQAAVHALKVAKRAGVKKLVIHTDSEFTINCITKWIHKWVRNDWKVSTGGDVKNKDDLILLNEAMEGIDVKWVHVRGHRGIHGNEMADTLARSGAKQYKKHIF